MAVKWLREKCLAVFAPLAAVACAETPSHCCAPGNFWVRVRVSFTTGTVRSAILATAGLLVFFRWRCRPAASHIHGLQSGSGLRVYGVAT